jgi:hypothetical protein
LTAGIGSGINKVGVQNGGSNIEAGSGNDSNGVDLNEINVDSIETEYSFELGERSKSEGVLKNEKLEYFVLTNRISTLYNKSGLRLSNPVMNKVIDAHEEVLKYGLETGNEKVIAIDMRSGRVMANEDGGPESVEFFIEADYTGKLLVVHNHPNGTPFSAVDVCTFDNYLRMWSLSVQGHNGELYLLRKETEVSHGYEEDALKDNFDKIRCDPDNERLSFVQKGELFVTNVSEDSGWIFVKGDELECLK